MKKLMIAAALIVAGVAAQAATVNWEVGAKAIFAKDATSTKETFVSQQTSYLLYFATEGASDTLYTALVSGDTTLADAIKTYSIASATSTYTTTKSAGKIDNVAAPTVKGVNPGDGGYFAVLVMDGDDFILSKEAPQQFYETGDEQFGDKTTVKYAKTEFSTTHDTRTGWTTAAPEPTSGLLLLLGVAGLALKRKRA